MNQVITPARLHRQAVARHLTQADGDTAQALGYVNSAYVTLAELADGPLTDTDLAETGAAADALDKLALAAAYLRDVARIVENRRLRERVIALENGQ